MEKENKSTHEADLTKLETDLERMEKDHESMFAKIQEINKRQKENDFKRSLNEAVESKVNKAMIKKIWHQWTTLIVVIGLITLHLFITTYFFKSDFDMLKTDFKAEFSRLEKQISNIQSIVKIQNNTKRDIDSPESPAVD